MSPHIQTFKCNGIHILELLVTLQLGSMKTYAVNEHVGDYEKGSCAIIFIQLSLM